MFFSLTILLITPVLTVERKTSLVNLFLMVKEMLEEKV